MWLQSLVMAFHIKASFCLQKWLEAIDKARQLASLICRLSLLGCVSRWDCSFFYYSYFVSLFFSIIRKDAFYKRRNYLAMAHCACPDGFKLTAAGQCSQITPTLISNVRADQALDKAISTCKEIHTQPVIIHYEDVSLNLYSSLLPHFNSDII